MRRNQRYVFCLLFVQFILNTKIWPIKWIEWILITCPNYVLGFFAEWLQTKTWWKWLGDFLWNVLSKFMFFLYCYSEKHIFLCQIKIQDRLLEYWIIFMIMLFESMNNIYNILMWIIFYFLKYEIWNVCVIINTYMFYNFEKNDILPILIVFFIVTVNFYNIYTVLILQATNHPNRPFLFSHWKLSIFYIPKFLQRYKVHGAEEFMYF